jgi:hypothetical protein
MFPEAALAAKEEAAGRIDLPADETMKRAFARSVAAMLDEPTNLREINSSPKAAVVEPRGEVHGL